MKKTIISIWILLLFSANQTFGQQTKIDVTIHSRVDTTQREIKEIADLWINYLNSKPDSLYDNPYWNNAEKVKQDAIAKRQKIEREKLAYGDKEAVDKQKRLEQNQRNIE